MTITNGYMPTEQQEREIHDWFVHYDALVSEGDVDAMADQALFPLNEVTDNPEGFGLATIVDRERFVTQMQETAAGSAGMEVRNHRTVSFLSSALAFVVTDAVFGSGEEAVVMRYGDLMVRTPTGWRFQTMVAGGMSAEL